MAAGITKQDIGDGRHDLTHEELEDIRSRLRSGDPNLDSTRIKAKHDHDVEVLKRLGVHHGAEPDTRYRTSSEVNAMPLTRDPGTGQFQSSGDQSPEPPAASGQAEPNAGQEGQQPETFRVEVGGQALELTKEQIAEAWQARKNATQIEEVADRKIVEAKVGKAISDWMASDPSQEAIDAVAHIMQTGRLPQSVASPKDPDMDDDDVPEPKAPQADPRRVAELEQKLARLVAKEQQREAQEARANLEKTVDAQMDQRAVFKDKAVRGLARQAILSQALADPNADLGEVIAAVAANASLLAKRSETGTDGQRAPAASKSSTGTSSEPQERASLTRRFDGTSAVHDKILAKLNAARR